MTHDVMDWTIATAIAMIIAHKRGDGATRDRLSQFLEQDLRDMVRQLEAFTAGTHSEQPINLFVGKGASAPPLGDLDNGSCSPQGSVPLASESHDKNGNYFGFLPAMALAWRHLLDGAPNPFRDIALPRQNDVGAWPEPVVPRAVITAALADRLTLPLSALSLATPMPDGHQDVPLFVDSPPKPADNSLGAPPPPRGDVKAINHAGGVLPLTINQSFPYPPLGLSSPEADNWTASAAFDEAERTLVESHEFRVEGNQLVTKVKLRAVDVSPGVPPHTTFARLRGTYSLSWTRQR